MSANDFDFEQVFDEDYLYFYEPMLAEASEADAALIWRLLALEPGLELLDLACGHGRIANQLAERGARVSGLDATPLFLERARQQAVLRRSSAEYVHGCARRHALAAVAGWQL